MIVTKTGLGTIEIRRIQDGQTLGTIEAHYEPVDRAAFSDDQRFLITESRSAKINRAWKFPECTLVASMAHPSDLGSREIIWQDGRFAITSPHVPGASRAEERLSTEFDSKNSVRLWRVSDGRLVLESPGDTQWAFSSSGRYIASWGRDNTTIKVWNAEDGKLVKELEGYAADLVSLSPDGKLLAVLSGTKAIQKRPFEVFEYRLFQLLRVSDGSAVIRQELGRDARISVDFSPNGGIAVMQITGLDGLESVSKASKPRRNAVMIFGRSGDTFIHTKTLVGHEVLAFSADWSYMATRIEVTKARDGYLHVVQVLRVEDGSTVSSHEILSEDDASDSTYMTARRCPFLTFSPDSRFFAAWNTKHGGHLWGTRIWRTSDGELVGELERSPGGQFIPRKSIPEELKDGFYLKTGKGIWRLSRGTLMKIRDFHRRQFLYEAPPDRPWTDSVSSDGRLLAYEDAESAGINLVKASSSRELIKTLQGGHDFVYSMGFSWNGQLFASWGSDMTVSVQRTPESQRIIETSFKKLGIKEDIYQDRLGFMQDSDKYLALNSGGKLLATGGWADFSVKLFRLPDGGVFRVLGGQYRVVSALNFRPDGKFLAAGYSDGMTQLWDLENGRLVRTLPRSSGAVISAEFTANGKLLAVESDDGTVRLWPMPDGASPDSPYAAPAPKSIACDVTPFEHRGPVFSPDGSMLATQDHDGSLCIWSTRDGLLLKNLTDPTCTATSISFSRDGKLLVASCGDKVNVWRLPDGRLSKSFAGAKILWAAFSAKGPLVCIEGGAGKSARSRGHLDGHPVRCFPAGADDPLIAATLRKEVLGFIHGDHVTFWSTGGRKLSESRDKIENDYSFSSQPSVSLSPDAAVFAARGRRGNVYVYRVSDGGLLQTIQAQGTIHPGDDGKLSLRFSPNGRCLASAAPDGTIKLFGRKLIDNEERFEHVLTLTGSPSGEGIAFTPEGYYTTSPEGSSLVTWAFSGRAGLEAFSFEQFESLFHKSEIIRARLGGDFDAGRTAPPVTRPPYVEMADHMSVKETPAARYPLKLLVSARDEVKTMRIFVNGKPTSEWPVKAKKKDFSLEVPLLPDMNRITAIAYNKEGFSSNPRYVDVNCTRSDLPKPNLYILSIGVSDYPNVPRRLQLDHAHTDAGKIVEAFKAQEGQLFERVYRCVLTNKEVTREKIGDALDALKALREVDVAVIFMAGHGARSPDGTFHFLTHAGSFKAPEKDSLGWKDLGERLANIKGRVIVLLDACHSGSITSETIVPNDELAHQLTRGGRTGVVVFAASKGREEAAETPDIEEGTGLFIYALCQALGPRAKEADTNDNGFVEFSELVEFVTRLVHRETDGEQTPWLARRELLGDFPVAKVLPSR